MAKYSRGDVVWAKVEKTAEGGFKNRPVLIIAAWPCAGTFDYLVCLCSTTKLVDAYKVSLSNPDFQLGGFAPGKDKGFIRPSYLTNVVEGDIDNRAGVLSDEKMAEVMSTIQTIMA